MNNSTATQQLIKDKQKELKKNYPYLTNEEVLDTAWRLVMKSTENHKIDYQSLLAIDNCIVDFYKTQDMKQPIILFGAGFALRYILPELKMNGLNIVCICDNSKSKQGTYFNSYEILSIEHCMLRFPDALYIISSPLYFWEIKKELGNMVNKEHICEIDFECDHYIIGDDFKLYFTKNIKRFEKFHEILGDDISKATLFNVVKAHISSKREDYEIAYTSNDDWYLFQSLLKPNANSVYLDCGAFDGDTILLFYNSAIDGYKSIIAFEPDDDNYPRLLTAIGQIPNKKAVKMGVYNYNGRLKLMKDGMYSAIANSNKSLTLQLKSNEIQIVTIDSFMAGRYVDIIKMDIEGAEYKALLGASETIKRYKPRLAICLYHNIEDFIEIPELILSMVPEYKLYLRHQSKGCTDTILYAVI